MKIFKSQSTFELSVVLNDVEAVLYREAFRHQVALKIPELDGMKYIIADIRPLPGEDAPENSWQLVLKHKAAE